MKKIMLSLLASVCCLAFAAEHKEEKQPNPARPQHRRKGERSLRSHLMWRAFAELSDAERREMTSLQRNDPEKFRKVMMEKVEKIMKTDREERARLRDLAQKYKLAKTDHDKKLMENQIKVILKKRFNERLNNNRRQLEAMKKRTAKLERELNKRAKNTEKIIDFQYKSLLDGKRPAPPHRRGKKSAAIPAKQMP